MTKRIQYKCSICNRSGAGYRETTLVKGSKRAEDIPPDNWLHMYGSIYLCSNCVENTEALRKADLLVKKEKESDRNARHGCILLCFFILAAIGIALYTVYIIYGREGIDNILAIIFAIAMLLGGSLFARKK